jgi:hydrogenase expression/formation protein HypE
VVKPLTFPGGSIGELAVNGTVNDLAVSGAKAEALVVTYVLEAGLPTGPRSRSPRHGRRARGRGRGRHRWRRHQSRRARQSRPDVHHHDRHRPPDSRRRIDVSLGASRRQRILLSGPIGDHGITILLAAANSISKPISLRHALRAPVGRSSLAPLAAPGIRWMRDPTRGGVATSLNELARDCGLGMVLFEDQIPVRDTVRGACELLGLDPLHIANEGQFLAVVSPEYADAALNALEPGAGREAKRR